MELGNKPQHPLSKYMDMIHESGNQPIAHFPYTYNDEYREDVCGTSYDGLHIKRFISTKEQYRARYYPFNYEFNRQTIYYGDDRKVDRISRDKEDVPLFNMTEAKFNYFLNRPEIMPHIVFYHKTLPKKIFLFFIQKDYRDYRAPGLCLTAIYTVADTPIDLKTEPLEGYTVFEDPNLSFKPTKYFYQDKEIILNQLMLLGSVRNSLYEITQCEAAQYFRAPNGDPDPIIRNLLKMVGVHLTYHQKKEQERPMLEELLKEQKPEEKKEPTKLPTVGEILERCTNINKEPVYDLLVNPVDMTFDITVNDRVVKKIPIKGCEIPIPKVETPKRLKKLPRRLSLYQRFCMRMHRILHPNWYR